MTHGIDTDFLAAAEIRDHPYHRLADALLQALLADGHDLAVAPQTLAEFIHIVTDPKRLLDLLLAATFQRAGMKRLITNNERDFKGFGSFEIVNFLT
ncbi:MAG: hypothetical protein J0M04_12355 [Verrucomicrobia bacterium]|nr:hypothetical protein [Verrucomicrobiota bacterium]